MTVKKAIGKIHLWLGLASGLVVFIVSITGCIFVFEKELFAVFNRELVDVHLPKNAKTLSLTALQKTAQQALGVADTVTRVTMYGQPERAWEFDAFNVDKKKASRGFWAATGVRWKRAFVNPYTGKVNGVIDLRYDFFTTIRAIHQHLYLNARIGSLIVGSATLIFVVMLLSGLFLWWPKNRAAAKQRFSLKWKATTRWKRKNYDLHNVLGFYILVFGLFIALTGMVWSFTWWENTVYKMFDGRINKVELLPNPNQPPIKHQQANVLDLAAQKLTTQNPSYHSIFLSINKSANMLVTVANFKDNSLWSGYNYYLFDLTTGKQYADLLQKNKTIGQKWRNSNYDLHTGKTLGYAGMTMAFCVSFICASLPVTGFYIWWGRKRKKNLRRY
ncbi:PepSY-associated TM helix domain-containing protein [Pedobacter endophyticus]|uniref:PepSY domain-containing protein n=1 Tax=Pedobacter endophyticus TaxID=2789740 RepID=A0A7S9KZY3_9SPHI|nr:PepSY-associated TM helix domain-containing protein [Pedobacter endophyticus]QPH39962.1 PepSY domain-containing protein [Pedobacter endophyticus]